ncbi:tetratricopeptide repeat protein [Striga asiatica]|uniref:Tetratricopeptide repeat protein n=1 Tax=Striga asiatica TaxID=4170 RepID=A0A5A7PZU2_STRAF|nr:tetratricopeptide repeat protein [Striga asiatica]
MSVPQGLKVMPSSSSSIPSLSTGGPLELPASSISQDDLWDSLEQKRKDQLSLFSEIEKAPMSIGKDILELRRQERMRLPGGLQADHLVDMLADSHGPERLVDIARDIREKGLSSEFDTETKTLLTLKREGVTEALLRKDWGAILICIYFHDAICLLSTKAEWSMDNKLARKFKFDKVYEVAASGFVGGLPEQPLSSLKSSRCNLKNSFNRSSASQWGTRDPLPGKGDGTRSLL